MLSAAEQAWLDDYAGYLDRCFFASETSPFYEVVDPAAGQPAFSSTAYLEAVTAYLADAMRSPYVTSDDENLGVCGTALSTAACDADLFSEGNACATVFTGSLGEGEPCFVLDCSPGLQCSTNGSDTAGCGVCTPVDVLPGEGESCEGTSCADGLAQSYATGSCVCVVPAVEGEACVNLQNYFQIAPCDNGLYCDYNSGNCMAFAGLGEACTDRDCSYELDCNTNLEMPVCEAPVRGENPGDACDLYTYDACGYIDDTALACVPSEGVGVCTAVTAVALGEPCTNRGTYDSQAAVWCLGNFSTTYCAFPQEALEGICTARPVAGELCSWDIPCVHTAYCDMPEGLSEGTCAALPLVGEACRDGYPSCEPGAFCSEAGLCISESEYISSQFPGTPETCWDLVMP